MAEPGWIEVMGMMADRINQTIMSAANPPENGEGVVSNALAKTIIVTRWDAQREIVDMVQGHIKFIRQERDRIKAEESFQDHGGPEVDG